MLMFNYLFLSETYEPVARDTCPPPPPFGPRELPLFNTTKPYER